MSMRPSIFVGFTASLIGTLGAIAVMVSLLCLGPRDLSPIFFASLIVIPIAVSASVALLIYSKQIVAPQKKLKETLLSTEPLISSQLNTETAPLYGLDAVTYSLQQLSDQVRETRKREKSVIENAADVICVIDIQENILQVNGAAKSVLGYSPNELTGKKLSDFLVLEDGVNPLQKVLNTERSIERAVFENRFRKKSGDIVDLFWSAHWSVSAGGLFCVAHDITERKRAEQLLKESEERIRGILEYLPAAVMVVTRKGFIDFINSTGTQFTGYSVEDIKTMKASEILGFCTNPFASKQLDELIDENRSGFDSQVMKQNGEHFPAEISLSRFDLAGKKSYLVICVDVTSKHAVEKAKREFVSMVSHDLKTPLSSILTALCSLESGYGGDLNEKGVNMAARARKESERLIHLVGDLLDIEKMKAGKFTMHFADSDLREIASSAVESVERFAQLHEVQVQNNITEPLTCYCDGARVIQVLVNLLDKGIKFSPPNEKVILSAKLVEEEILVTIANKGRVIPVDKIATIFERFEQIEESDSTEKNGTGLGLTICKTIVDQHQGKIWVSSDNEHGTQFFFSLPARNSQTDLLPDLAT